MLQSKGEPSFTKLLTDHSTIKFDHKSQVTLEFKGRKHSFHQIDFNYQPLETKTSQFFFV